MAKRDIYREITDKIIAVLDRVEVDDYEAPFAGLAAQGLPSNPVTNHQYQGINIPSLWCEQQAWNFTSNHWATYKQWKAIGAQVIKEQQASPIVFYKTVLKEENNEHGECEQTAIPVLRRYSVFNACQVDGYDHHESGPPNTCDLVTRIKNADAFCTNTGADIRHGAASAFYNRAEDFISIPETIAFVDTRQASASENYYSTLLHELTHWTGAQQRLDRDKAKTRGEIEKYAFEELVAELGAAFLCSGLGIVQTPRDDHAIYIKSWLQALRNDKTLIFKASAKAAKAAEYLHGLQPEN